MIDENIIKNTLYQWLSQNVGDHEISVIDFDSDFVSGNIISGDINGDAWVPVQFKDDHQTTLDLFIEALFSLRQNVLSAVQTGNRQVTVTGALCGVDLVYNGPSVTGGVSQSIAQITVLQPAKQITVIFADQTAPRPAYPYATIRLQSSRRVGFEEFRGIDESTKLASWYGLRVATVAINFFNEKAAAGLNSLALQEISKAYFSLTKNIVNEKLSEAGIAIIDRNPIQNLTDFLETISEDRAFFDFFIGLSELEFENVGSIQKVNAQGTVSNEVFDPFIIG